MFLGENNHEVLFSQENESADPVIYDFSQKVWENSTVGSFVGMADLIAAGGLDANSTVYTFIDGENNNSLFTLETNGTIRNSVVFDFETDASNYELHIRGTDENGKIATGVFIVELMDDGGDNQSFLVRGFAPADGNFSLKLDVREETEFLIRTLAESLSHPNKLPVCSLEVRNGFGTKIAQDYGWAYNDDKDRIQSLGLAPGSVDDPALIITLSEGNYTISVVDVISVGGVGKIEIYALGQAGETATFDGLNEIVFLGEKNQEVVFSKENESADPVIYDFSQKVWENSPVGSFVGMADLIAAGGLDVSSTVYTFIDGENNNSLFTLETNGTIRTAKIFDYESDDAMFALHVNGTDGEGRSATGLIIVELIDDALEKTVISFKGLVTLSSDLVSSDLVLRLKIDQEVNY